MLVHTCARRAVLVCLASVLAGGIPLQAQRGAQNGEWRATGADKGGTKYSPLDQITRDNFAKMKIAWRWKTPDAMPSKRTPDGGEWTAPLPTVVEQLEKETPNLYREKNGPIATNFQATPLMIGGALFINTALSQGASIDAKSGQTRWIYNPRSYEEGTTSMTVTWRQRGVAYWTDGKDERVFWGTGNGYLVCVSAKTGHPCPDFGAKGRVDTMVGLPRANRKDRDYLNAMLVSIQSPPIVVGDVVIHGSSISDRRVTMESIPGYVRAWDVRTGKHLWDFRPIPRPGEEGVETWKNDSWSYSGNANVWSIMSADEELGYVYLPTTTPTNDYYGGHRIGDNLFAESLVCVDAKTGKKIWHFQGVHHGLWDYDFGSPPNLLDIVVDGKPIKAVAQVSKQGFIYTFDRVTGRPVWPIEERKVPTETNMPGEVPSPTQPFPTKPLAFEAQGVTIDDLVDFTPEIRAMAVEAIKGFTIGPLFTPPMRNDGKTKGTLFRPTTSGGANWMGAGIDPETGYLYVPSNNQAALISFYTPSGTGATLKFTHGAPENARLSGEGEQAFPRMPEGLPLFKPPYSRMTAVDMRKGEHAWMTPLGNGDRIRNHKRLRHLNLPPLGGDGRGGPLVTKTLLVNAITTGGTDGGPSLVAYDKATGKPVASVDLPAGAIGNPMTYMLDGRQYIALTVGGDVPELIAFTLP